MGRFDVSGDFDEINKQLSRLMNLDEVATKMLTAGAEILEPAVNQEAEPYRKSGDMIKSIKRSKVSHNKNGYFTCVRPTGKDEKGIRNMEKMAWLEFGAHKVQARPVLSRAIARTENKVVKRMQEVFEKEVSP